MTEIGLVINVDASGAITGVQNLGAQLVNVRTAADSASSGFRSLRRDGLRATHDLQMATHNAVLGLWQMQNQLQGVFDITAGALRSSTDAAMEYEVAMNRVAVVMGMTGPRAELASLREEYEAIEATVQRIGRDTEFTMSEAADAFVLLKQAGLAANDALSIIDSTMAFSSASSGMVDMSRSAETMTLAMSALGLEAGEEVNRMADSFVRLTNVTKMSAGEISQSLRSLGTARITLAQTDPNDLMATVGVLRQMGRSAAQSGNDIQGFARQLGHVNLLLKGGGLGTRGGRVRVLALEALGITGDMLTEGGEFRALPDIINRVNESVAQRIREGAITVAEAGGYLRRAFGSQQAMNMFLLSAEYADQYGQSITELGDILRSADGDALDAQAAFLETLTGKVQVLMGSIDRLKNNFIQPLMNVIKEVVDVGTRWTNTLAEWLVAHPNVARAVTYTTAAVAALSAAGLVVTAVLLAIASAMMVVYPLAAILTHRLKAVVITNAGFSGLFGSINYGFGLLLSRIIPVVAFLALFGYALNANVFGVRDQIVAFGRDVAAAFSVMSDALSGRGIDSAVWDSMSYRAQEMVLGIVSLTGRIKDFATGLWMGAQPALRVTAAVLGFLVSTIIWALGYFVTVGSMLANWTTQQEGTRTGVRLLGVALGFIIAPLILFKTTAMAVTGVMYLWRALLWGVTIAQSAFSTAMAIGRVAMSGMAVARTVAAGLAAYTGAATAAAAAQSVLTAAALAFPGTWLAAAIIAVVASIGILIGYGGRINAWVEGVTDGFVSLWDIIAFGFLSFLGPIGWGIMVVLGFLRIFGVGWSELGNAMSAAMAGMMHVLRWFVDGFGQLWDGLVASFRQIMEVIWSDMRALGTMFANWFSIGLEAIVAVARAIGSAVRFLFVELPIRFYEGGKEMMRKLVQGLEDSAGWVSDKMAEIIENVVGFFQHSPAKHGPLTVRPMEQSGANLIHNMLVGVESQGPAVSTAMTNTIERVQSATLRRSDVRVETRAGSTGSQDRSSPSNEGGGRVEINVTIGDIIAQVRELDESNASGFMDQLIEMIGPRLLDEYRRAGLTT